MKLLVSALEHSANIHLKELQRHFEGNVEMIGIFDAALGNPMVDLRSLAIMGITDALKKLRFFFKLADSMTELAADADKVLLMDSSGFNLPLAKKIKKRYPEKEIIYYILPQAWAWRKGRIKTLSKTVDRLLSILPFEKSCYPPDAPIEYVGHPLLDEIMHFKSKAPKSIRKITFMPGSRRKEIKALMPIFKELHKKIDAESFIVIPEYFDAESFRKLYGDLSGFKITHDAHKTLYESDFAFICSGTATLEASLIGTPFVLCYITGRVDYFIAKNMLNLDYVGLGNIFSLDFQKRLMHPELIQNDLNVGNLLKTFNTMDRKRFMDDVRTLRNYLAHGSAEKVSRILLGRDKEA